MDFLIALLVFLIVAAIVYWIFTLLPFPQPLKNIILAIIALILLLIFLNWIGVFGGPPHYIWHRG